MVSLHPAPLAHLLHPIRVREMHLETLRLQRVDRPVPAICRLDRDRRTLPSLRHFSDKAGHRIVDPHALELATAVVDPHDHRPVQMQGDTDELLLPSDTVTQWW